MNILLAGEQWTTVSFEIKGFDYFGAHSFDEGGQWLVEALQSHGHRVTYLRSCDAPKAFPETLNTLAQYNVVILSDLGTNSLFFHPEVLTQSKRHPNRLHLLRASVEQGGGLLMIGGWMSFQGMDGRARYRGTPVEECLPVSCEPYDDRVEVPEGVVPRIVQPSHPVLEGIDSAWPFFLGYNRTSVKQGATLLAQINKDPLLAVRQHGRGRTAVFTSDCAPHWGPPEFLAWKHYGTLWNNIVTWLAGK
jgi:uncharacterized membrane protein